MKALEINGHNGEKYHIYYLGRKEQLEVYAELIREHRGGLIWPGNEISLTFVINGIRQKVDIRPKYRWDGASIPRFAQPFIGKPTDYEFRVPSMVHDDGYEERSERVINDVIFLYLLHVFDVPEWKSDVMYKSVRAGGHLHYASDTSRFWRFIRKLL